MKNLKKKLLAVVLIATMIFSTSGFAFAAESNTTTDETKYVAQIGDNKYETLQEAIDEARDGDTIIVLADIYDEFVTIDPGENTRLTIDFNKHGITAKEYDDIVYIYSGSIKILDATIINMNENRGSNTCVYISDADVTFENCYADTFSDESRGYYITGTSNVSLNECYFMDVDIIFNGEFEKNTTPKNVERCFVGEDATLTINGGFIYVADGKGIYSCGTTNINDSWISAGGKYSCGIASAEGGKVNINDGYYCGNPALYTYDADSYATIKKGEFESINEGYPAIVDSAIKEGFKSHITIASGSMASPSKSEWRTEKAEIIDVYKKYAAPSSAKAKLSKYNATVFSWSKVPGAQAYKVYYKKSSAKSYTYLTTTTNTSVTKTGLSTGVEYDFRVYPCDTLDNEGDVKYCQSSSYKAASIYTLKKLSTPKVGKKSKYSVTVKWTNIPGEAGYQISKSTKKSGTNIVSTYKTTSGKSKVIKAKKGKTYYYKVRAFAYDSKGKKVYGPWSATKSYRIK